MSMPSQNRRALRAVVAALGVAGLIVLGAAPGAFGDEAEPELVVGGVEPIAGAKPGTGFDQPVTVANKSAVVAEKVWVSYAVTRGLDFADVPSNCLTQHVPSYDEMPERWFAVCAFDQAVGPGDVYAPEKPIRVKVLDRALNDELRARVSYVAPWADENGSVPVAGTAPAVKLVEAPAGVAGAASVVTVPVTAVNTADYRVTGAALKGSVGDTVTMKVTFANAGPAWVRRREGERSVSVTVTLPAGVSVVKPAWFCRPKGKAYVCGMRSLDEGRGETYTFDLRIDKRVPGAKGSVSLSTEPRPFDPDKGNDKADITLDVTGGGSTGSTGGGSTGGGSTSGGSTSGGSTSGAGGGSGSGAAGGSGGGSMSGSGGGSMSGSGGGSTGGSLAESGSSALALTGMGAATVGVGAGALLVVRRQQARNAG